MMISKEGQGRKVDPLHRSRLIYWTIHNDMFHPSLSTFELEIES